MREWIDLGWGDDRVEGALALAPAVQVIVRPSSSAGAERLEREGFQRVLSQVHALVPTNRDHANLSRPRRRILVRQLRLWDEFTRNPLRLRAGSNVALDERRRLFEEIVGPQLAQRGINPHGAAGWPGFSALMDRGLVVTAEGDMGPKVGALALLDLMEARSLTLRGPFATHRQSIVPGGIVCVLANGWQLVRRAFLEQVGWALSGHGIDFWSWGGDDGFVDPGYAPILKDKWSWAEGIGWKDSSCGVYLSAHRDGAFRFGIQLTLEGQPRVVTDESHRELATELNDRLRRLASPAQLADWKVSR